MVIAFDFDGTLAKSTSVHRVGWERCLETLSIQMSLDAFLPYEPNLKERFDSYRRIKSGIENDKSIYLLLQGYFSETNIDKLVNEMMDMKESLTISHILKLDTYLLIETMGVNLISALAYIKSFSPTDVKLGIISSTRKTIISAYLTKVNLISYFDYIVGEEDLYENGVLRDKPDIYASHVIQTKLGESLNIYIGDNPEIDGEFASKTRANFIYATYKNDFFKIIKDEKTQIL